MRPRNRAEITSWSPCVAGAWGRRVSAATTLLLVLGALGTAETLAQALKSSEPVATVLRIPTRDGTLVVEVDDPAVQVRVDSESDEVLITGAGVPEVRLKPGQGPLKAVKDGKPGPAELIAISRGGRPVVKINLEPAGTATAAPPRPAAAATAVPRPAKAVTEVRPGEAAFAGESPAVLTADEVSAWFAVFAPDGKTLVAGGESGVVKLWELPSLKLRTAGENEGNPLRCAAFSNDGKLLATGHVKGIATIWDPATAKPLTVLKNQSTFIRTLAFSPDGKTLATGGESRSVTLWNVATGKVSLTLPPLPETILKLVFSPDGKTLAVAFGDSRTSQGGVHLYDAGPLTLRAELPGIDNYVWSVAFSPDGKTVATSDVAKRVRLWDSTTGQERRSFKVPLNMRVVTFLPDGKTLALAGTLGDGRSDGTAILWDLENERPKSVLTGHGSLIMGMSLSTDGRLLATASTDATVRLWDLARLPVEAFPTAPTPTPTPTPTPPAAASPTLTAAVNLDADTKEAWFAVFAPDGKTLATGGNSGSLKLWDATSHRERSVSQASPDGFKCAAFAPDSKTLATGRYSGTVTVWETSGRLLKDLRQHTGPIRSLCFSPDGKRLVASGQDRTLTVWETATWKVVGALPDQGLPILSTTIAPDGKLLAIALGDSAAASPGGVRLFDLDTLVQRLELPGINGAIWSVAFSPDGKTLATGTRSLVRLWDPITGRQRAAFVSAHFIRIVAFSPDGMSLVTAGTSVFQTSGPVDGTGQVWDLATLRPTALLKDHGTLLVGVSFSPDGRTLATAATGDPEVRLWDLSKLNATTAPVASAPAPQPSSNPVVAGDPLKFVERPIRTPELPPSIWSLALSGDGRKLVTGHAASVRIWDVAARRELGREDIADTTVAACAFAPDGKRCATAENRPNNEPVIVVRGGTTGKVLRILRGHTAGLNDVVFSPDGQEIASASWDKTVRTWDPAKGEPKQVLNGHSGQVTAVAYSPDGKLLASSSLDRTARLWDAATGELKAICKGHEAGVQKVIFAPDGKTLATASYDMTIKLWDAADGGELATLAGHEAPVLALAFSPDGTRLASAASPWGGKFGYGPKPSELRLWDVADRKTSAVLKGHSSHVFALAFAPDGKTLISGSHDRTIRLWDVESQKELGTIPAQPTAEAGTVTLAVAYAPDGRVIATAGEDKLVTLHDAATWEVLKTFTGHADVVAGLAFSPDGLTLASASYDRTARLWNVADGTEKAVLQGHKNWIFGLAFSPDGKLLATASYDKLAKLWDVAEAKEIASFDAHKASVRSVAFSPDGKTLATGSGDRTVKLWDVASRTERASLKGHKGAIRAVLYSPDNTWLASAAEDGTIKLWDLATGKERATLTGHADMVNCLAYSPEDKVLASGGWDSTIKFWDLATGKERVTLRGHTEAVAALAFAPGGRQLVTAGYDKRVKVWVAPNRPVQARPE